MAGKRFEGQVIAEVRVKEYRKEKSAVIHVTQKIDLAKNQTSLRQIFESQNIKVAEDIRIDVYNPTNEFKLNGDTYMAGRAEPRNSEFDSLTIFFKREGNHWEPLLRPIFKLQDPSITKIGDEFILCGVKLNLNSYTTIFYKGKSLSDLVEFAEGPEGMKDIRLVELNDHQIGIYTRPQRLPDARRGQIGFTTINNLTELNPRVIESAPLMSPCFFAESEWGGVNEATILPDGRIFVLGHHAHFDGHSQKHYYSMAFIHEPKTGLIQNLGIIAERNDFPEGSTKRPDLLDVLFSAGVKFLKNGRILLKVGMSDTEVGEMEREMPQFLFGDSTGSRTPVARMKTSRPNR